MFLALALAQITTPPKWYGPVTVSFNVQVAGNPYDYEANDLRVRFMPDKGPVEERLAWVDIDGTVRATLVSQNQTRFRAVLIRNGKQLMSEPEGGMVDLKLKLPKGYIRRDTEAKNRFKWDNGEYYYPLGFNLGWQSEGLLPMREQISKMSANGVNWARIWASSWDSKNPWWPQGNMPAEKGELWPKALVLWDELVATCDQFQVPFQMVLFNHGSFSSNVNPNWPDHPWNAAKGGFLKDAADFFTDKEAKKRAKMWLRYAVARYGHSPSLMSWELFNEVEWVDARYKNRWADIEAWHKEMAEFIRSIDPYKHLVTTSSAMDRSALWTWADYYQPHTYPSNVTAAIAGAEMLKDKPYFFGEFGPSDQSPAALAQGIRDGIYGAMLSNHAGAGQYWYWDVVEKQNLYPIYKTAAAVLTESELAQHPAAKSFQTMVSTPGSATLSFGPGRGWDKTEKMSFELPREATPANLSKLSAYLQSLSGNNKALFPEPLTFKFNAAKAGTFRMRIGQSSKGGAKVTVYVNDKAAATQTWPAAEKEANVDVLLEAPFVAGANTIRIENTGADWVNVKSFDFTDLSPQATAMVLAESDWMMMRLQSLSESAPTVNIGALPLSDGPYEVTAINLDTGDSSKSTANVQQAAFNGYKMTGADMMLIFKRKR